MRPKALHIDAHSCCAAELKNTPSLYMPYIKQHSGFFLIGVSSDCPMGFIAAKPPGSVGGLDSC